jgi:hypothetical protein
MSIPGTYRIKYRVQAYWNNGIRDDRSANMAHNTFNWYGSTSQLLQPSGGGSCNFNAAFF